MQLDKTRIAVRERGIYDTLDLALHVWRVYAWPLLVTTALAVAPLAVMNDLLVGWMIQSPPDAPFTWEMFGAYARFTWTMLVLIVIEAPLASVFATSFLGKAVFLERPRIGRTVHDVRPFWGRLIWCHLVMRGVLPAILLVAVMDRATPFSGLDWLLMLLVATVGIRRATAPFVNEIVLLEQNPLWTKDPNAMTVRKRSYMLHSPSTPDLIHRFFVSSIFAVLLTVFVMMICYLITGVFFGGFRIGAGFLRWSVPLSMWLVSSFFGVVRFLSYLDLRIRLEGWEVELRMRAEGARLAGTTP